MINLNTSRSHFVFTLNSLTTRSDKGFRGSLIPVTMVGGGGVLETNFDATPFRSLVYDGNAHF